MIEKGDRVVLAKRPAGDRGIVQMFVEPKPGWHRAFVRWGSDLMEQFVDVDKLQKYESGAFGKCARTTCVEDAADLVHADSGARYCAACARRINRHAERDGRPNLIAPPAKTIERLCDELGVEVADVPQLRLELAMLGEMIGGDVAAKLRAGELKETEVVQRWIEIDALVTAAEGTAMLSGLHHLGAIGDAFARGIVYDALAQLGGVALELGVRELEKADPGTFRLAEAPSITGYTLGLMAWAVDGVPIVRRGAGEVQGVYVLWPPGQGTPGALMKGRA